MQQLLYGKSAGDAAPVFQQLKEQGADFLLTVKANQKTLHRQIRSQFQGKRQIPFEAGDHEKSHGRDITWKLRAKQAPEHFTEAWIGTSWIVEVNATGSRDGKPFQATLPGVNYVGGSRQLRRRVPPCHPPAMAGGWQRENGPIPSHPDSAFQRWREGF